MQFAIWLVGLMCHLSTLVRDTLPHRLHPKQGKIRFLGDSVRRVYDPSRVCVSIPAPLRSRPNSFAVFPPSESLVKQLSSYEIITPLRVNDFGESFPLQLHYRRRRRSLGDHLSGLRLLYRIDAFGERFHLNLTAHSDFIAPSYTVVHLGAEEGNGTERSDMRHCFFRGHVNGRSDFPAVFSLCTGLVSIAASLRTLGTSRFLVCPRARVSCPGLEEVLEGGGGCYFAVAQRRRGGEPRLPSAFQGIWLLLEQLRRDKSPSGKANPRKGPMFGFALNPPVGHEGIAALGVCSSPPRTSQDAAAAITTRAALTSAAHHRF